MFTDSAVVMFMCLVMNREAMYTEEFLHLSAEQVQQLMSRDTIQIRSEEDVVDCIYHWCRWDMVNRQHQLPNLVDSCVRVSLLSDADLLRLMPDGADQDIITRVSAILQAKQQQKLQECPRGYHQVIVVCGGEGQISK